MKISNKKMVRFISVWYNYEAHKYLFNSVQDDMKVTAFFMDDLRIV